MRKQTQKFVKKGSLLDRKPRSVGRLLECSFGYQHTPTLDLYWRWCFLSSNARLWQGRNAVPIGMNWLNSLLLHTTGSVHTTGSGKTQMFTYVHNFDPCYYWNFRHLFIEALLGRHPKRIFGGMPRYVPLIQPKLSRAHLEPDYLDNHPIVSLQFRLINYPSTFNLTVWRFFEHFGYL